MRKNSAQNALQAPANQEARAVSHGERVFELSGQKAFQAAQSQRVGEGVRESGEKLPKFIDLPLRTGQKVYCQDGYAGIVVDVCLYPQEGSDRTFVLQYGRFFRRRIIVPFKWIDYLKAESVYLTAKKEDLAALPEIKPDSALEIDIERSLWEDVYLRRTALSGIHVSANCGVVLLEGYVPSSHHKTRAEEAAQRVVGVGEVKNCLVVDRDLKNAAAKAVAEVPLSRGERILVGVRDGFIILNGEVSTVETRLSAEKRAGDVPQIRGVINNIQVPESEDGFERPRSIQPRIGAVVYASDMPLGRVERVILNPINRLVAAILVDGRFPDPNQKSRRWFLDDGEMSQRRVVIPVHAVQHLTETAVFLEIDSMEASRFEDFEPDIYALPDAGWRPPFPYHPEQVLLEDPLPVAIYQTAVN